MDSLLKLKETEQKHKTIVSLKSEIFKRGKCFVTAKSLTTLKRKSKGYDILNDDISENIEMLDSIEGIHTLPDGIYELKYANLSRDYESGLVESDGYKLIPA